MPNLAISEIILNAEVRHKYLDAAAMAMCKFAYPADEKILAPKALRERSTCFDRRTDCHLTGEQDAILGLEPIPMLPPTSSQANGGLVDWHNRCNGLFNRDSALDQPTFSASLLASVFRLLTSSDRAVQHEEENRRPAKPPRYQHPFIHNPPASP